MRYVTWMTVFYLAMAFLESAVVVYLRALYYPEGFAFPLVPMERSLVFTEVWREVATLVMLLAPAALITRSALDRFAWFCFGFGVWDLGYYLWLKVLVDWPIGLSTWDLLFLVPVPWVGPVWAPCTIALGLIILGLHLLRQRQLDQGFRVPNKAWGFLVFGAMIMIVSFILEPMEHMFTVGSMIEIVSSESVDLGAGMVDRYVPATFPWKWFIAGWTCVAIGVVLTMPFGKSASGSQ